MMAVRHGAGRVASIEMVPALAQVAEQIIATNGYSETVVVHKGRSDETSAAQLGKRFDILVCEIVDDNLLGEGILASVADARRRLLSPTAIVIPRAASVFVLAVELRTANHAGLLLDDHNIFLCDLPMTPEPLASAKVQHLKPTEWKQLSKPMRLFTFELANAPLEGLREGGTSPPLPFSIERSGVFNALLLYFSLDLDGDPSNIVTSGPECATSHWDQGARWLPMECHVKKGQKLSLIATHSDHHVATMQVSGILPEMVQSAVGHPHMVSLPAAQGCAVSLMMCGGQTLPPRPI